MMTMMMMMTGDNVVVADDVYRLLSWRDRFTAICFIKPRPHQQHVERNFISIQNTSRDNLGHI